MGRQSEMLGKSLRALRFSPSHANTAGRDSSLCIETLIPEWRGWRERGLFDLTSQISSYIFWQQHKTPVLFQAIPELNDTMTSSRARLILAC